MFLSKYEIFIHDFVGFDGCLLDPEKKSQKEGQNSLFTKISDPKFAQASNQLAWAEDLTLALSKQLTLASCGLLGRVDAFKSKQ